MKLPNNEIGISDIMDYRECPQRFAFSMRRHIELPARLQLEPNEKDEPPEKTNWTNAYGSAIHEAIHHVEQGDTHTAAIDKALLKYGTYLNPQDIELLRKDLDVYERRRPLGVRLVGVEMELRIPLFVDEEYGQIWFRFRLDVLQRMIANPGVFLHRDYKSSKWQKSPKEVREDPQMWAYNLGIHEYFPECKTLLQTYDQLRYGEEPITKNDEQRALMRQWLIDNVKIILRDETFKPKINDFCAYCPLVVTCREPRRATEYTRGVLAMTAPLTQEGRRVKVEFFEEAMTIEELIERELPKMMRTRKHIEHVEKALKERIERMPQEERERLGWRLKERTAKDIGRDGLRALHEQMGDSFYDFVRLSVNQLEDFVGKPKKGEALPDELQIVRNWQTERTAGFNIVPANSGKKDG